jgi:hypothetical protein
VTDFLEVAFTQEINKTECIIFVKQNLKGSDFSISILELPNNYELKEMILWQKGSLVLLLTSNPKTLQDDKPHSILGMIDTSTLESANMDNQGSFLNLMQTIGANSSVNS